MAATKKRAKKPAPVPDDGLVTPGKYCPVCDEILCRPVFSEKVYVHAYRQEGGPTTGGMSDWIVTPHESLSDCVVVQRDRIRVLEEGLKALQDWRNR